MSKYIVLFKGFVIVTIVVLCTETVSGLELIETGGEATSKNIAAASAGAIPFAFNDLGGRHVTDKLNDGIYGNGSTWIGGTDGSFSGVRFKQTAEIGAIAFGRDNTGKYTDRCIGTYFIQYTQVKDVDEETPDDQWKNLITIDYAASPPPSPAGRHLFRFPVVKATAVRIITVRNQQAGPHALGIDELEVYELSDAIAGKAVQSWKPAFAAALGPLKPWKGPIVKQGYLKSPLVEVTPLSFKGKLYLMECWRSKWKWDDVPDLSVHKQSEIWMAELPDGSEHYDKRQYLGRVLEKCTLGTAIIWDDRVYVYAVSAASSDGGQVVYMTWTEDMKSWSEPVKIFNSPAGKIFNVAVTKDANGMVFLWESNGVGQPFTMCCGRVEKPGDPWNPGIIAGACYGLKKYTGGPALYNENGWYYMLYLEALGGGRYETRITRSKDLKNWQDAPTDRPFVTFNSSKHNLPLRPSHVSEINASDAELCFHKGRTLIYFTGGDQLCGGDLQWATYDGTLAELFAVFFSGDNGTDLVAPKHRGDWTPVLIAPENTIKASAKAPIETLRKYRPSLAQQAYQEGQLGAFIHFGMATYVESDMHATPEPEIFNPVDLDAEQWVKAAKSFGAKHVVLTVKHHNGHCLWPTKTTKYSVKSSPWKDGKGDVVREFVDACRKYGLRPGLYISGGDMHFKCYSAGGSKGRHIVGDRETYFKIFMQQLEELLTGYGPQSVIWFDGAFDPFGWDMLDSNNQRIGSAYGDAIAALVRKHQPGAVIFQGTQPDLRWSGNERGWASYPLWNVIPQGKGPLNWLGLDDFGYIIVEANLHTRSTWFWTANSDHTLVSVKRLVQAYDSSIGRGANLLINMTPDTSGLIPAVEVQRYADFGKELHQQFDLPVAHTCSANGWTSGGILELTLDSRQTIDHIVIEEDLREGQRVIAYAIEAQTGDQWASVAQGLSIGRKRIERFAPVTTDRVRLCITGATEMPVIRRFAVY